MAGTRSSNRINSSPQSEKATNGTKRKADDASPPASQKAKRDRPSKASKQQKTIEETLPATGDQPESEDVLIKDAEQETEANGEGSPLQASIILYDANLLQVVMRPRPPMARTVPMAETLPTVLKPATRRWPMALRLSRRMLQS